MSSSGLDVYTLPDMMHKIIQENALVKILILDSIIKMGEKFLLHDSECHHFTGRGPFPFCVDHSPSGP